ncbi:MAG: periplasmic heavy metal sensor [Bacteroidales bacterium]|nr:periplasmic heavy metal sensor [Bacteroidales bacterium]
MKKRNNTRLLIYAVIVLAAMNIATFATIWYHVRQSNQEQAVGTTGQLEGDAQAFSDRYFRELLEFTPQQMNAFRGFSTDFRQQARSINQRLIECRISMLDEMRLEEPDPAKLESLSDSIGTLHSRLKHYTYRYYLDIKEICSEDQTRELNSMFEEFFVNDYRMGPQGSGRPQGRRGPWFQSQTGNQ